jgi:ClpP class serine protease
MGYHEVEDTNPLTLLQELEKYTLQHEDSQVVTSFLAYVSQFRTISQEEFLSEAVRLNRLFSAEQIVRLGSTLDRLQECRAKHDNWEDVWRCVREAGGGQSATAAAR